MSVKESFRERQIQELEAIKAIFGSDVEDLRPQQNNNVAASRWKPTDIRILLTPLRDSSNGMINAYVKTKLHIVCPSKYPKVVPKISLDETQGLSDQLKDELLEKLRQQSVELRGEVMIFELAQTVQDFLLKHNKPPRGSFYDEMVQEKQKREEELIILQKQKETQERQNLIDEVERRKQIFKVEAKRRGEPRRSISESNRHQSSSESSESSSPYYRGYLHTSKCLDHRNSETLYFHKVGKQIKRGSCLGHSEKGYVAYNGIDLDTGQLLYITEWVIKYAQIEQCCGVGNKCLWNSAEHKCNGNHRVDDVISSIEKQVAILSQLHHKNLVQYECVLCIKKKEGLVVYLVQDFVLGTSVFSISNSLGLGWCLDGVRMIARGVLDVLVYLHNKGVSYSNLLDKTVFMENTGTIKCTDYSLVPNLLEITSSGGQRSIQGDLPALGDLVGGLITTPSYEMSDFIEKCNSDRTLSASELLNHPFLRPPIFGQESKDTARVTKIHDFNVDKKSGTKQVMTTHLENTTVNLDQLTSKHLPLIPTLTTQSRLRTEFQVLMYLGKGAFGDVLKVRNILDNREYAIKRIPLTARSKQLYKKMTREVELLSRLNHENVVRYFNSWIECVNDEDMEEMNKLITNDWSVSHDSIKQAKSTGGQIINETEDSSSSSWNNYMRNLDESDSDGIEFVDSNGEIAVYSDEYEHEELDAMNKTLSPKPPVQIMCIQMEFCEKCTLRTAIDDNLYKNADRLWRLFREIAEGLSHIHQQGIIHRDLKPVNIFLDSHDQIKIGDFGLATTSFLALQSQAEPTIQHITVPSIEDGTGTGKVGTTLYVAPELTGNASKSTYSQKVDMYTLGIILFEMCQPPFSTSMERVQTIVALRSPNIVFPETLISDNQHENTVKIIRWLLNHDPSERPTAEELLSSDLVPPTQLEANELQEMLRHALANPQSKSYKHLVSRCLQQQSDEVLEHTYHAHASSRTMKSWNTPITLDSLVSLNPVIEFVKGKIVGLFRRHGGIEIDTPLLSPLSKNTKLWYNPVRLMTHSGCVVVLPSELRTQFARHIAMSGVNFVRRYCVDRVYREEKVFNFHPKQNYECSFDIITPNDGSQLIDAELLAIAFDITNEIPGLREKNLTIRINHTNLLRAILLYCNVPQAMFEDLFGNILDFIEGRISKFQFQSSVTIIMEKSRCSATALIDLLLASFLIGGTRSNVDDSPLRVLVRGKGEASSIAKEALRQLETVVALAQSLGVTCPIYICAGLPISFDRAGTGGIVWQMVADLRPNRTSRSSVIAVGERYDSLLHEFQKQAQSFYSNMLNREISGAGLSFSLDKLVASVSPDYVKECRSIDVGICVSGLRPPLKDILYIMRMLWSVGIRCGIVESAVGIADEAQDMAKLGALHIILVAENGSLRIRSWERDRFQERHVTRAELVDFIQKVMRNDINNVQSMDSLTPSSNSVNIRECYSCTSVSNVGVKSIHSSHGIPNIQVVFFTHDKLTANYRRRYENQVAQQMSSILPQFSKTETITVFIVELPPVSINAIVGAVDPRKCKKGGNGDLMNSVIERFPKYKRYISEIWDEICDFFSNTKSPILALYSTSDSFYRIII